MATNNRDQRKRKRKQQPTIGRLSTRLRGPSQNRWGGPEHNGFVDFEDGAVVRQVPCDDTPWQNVRWSSWR